MDKEVINAKILFNNIIVNEDLVFDSEFIHLLDKSICYYVPNMMNMHREIWYEEVLIIFYYSNNIHNSDDIYYYNNNGKINKLYFISISSYDEILIKFKKICNVIDHSVEMPEDAMPFFHIINYEHLKKIINLVSFS